MYGHTFKQLMLFNLNEFSGLFYTQGGGRTNDFGPPPHFWGRIRGIYSSTYVLI